MDVPQIYAITAGGILVSILLWRIISLLLRRVIPLLSRFNIKHFLLEHVFYPYLFQRLQIFRPITWAEICFQIIYWVGTLVCNLVGVHNAAEAGRRAAALSLANLIPLFLSHHLGLAATTAGLPLHTILRLHFTASVMAVGQALIHICIRLSKQPFSISRPIDIYGLVVSARA